MVRDLFVFAAFGEGGEVADEDRRLLLEAAKAHDARIRDAARRGKGVPLVFPVILSPPDVCRLAEEAIVVLRSAPSGAEYFGANIEWIEQRLALWRRRSWRVGVIGITSSGKSKLLNYLLGGGYLPTRVGPSSNCLVLCSKGPLRASVLFDNGRVETVRTAIGERLRELADERHNAKNAAGVREIELQTPEFCLGDTVTLVDTPGLDALGHAEHEKLTLEVFLPTVDAVVFTASMKANSDQQIAGYAAVVAVKRKPLILVQTMLDSVVPKIGVGGTILKRRDEVANEHGRRVRRILHQAGHRDAAIVQASAISGEGIAMLVAVVEKEIERLRPRIERARLAQMSEHLTALRDSESTRLGSADESALTLEPQVQFVRSSIASAREMCSAKLREASAELEQSGQSLLSRARTLSRDSWDAALELAREAGTINGLEGLRATLARLDQDLASVAKMLNLREEDYAIPAPRTKAQGTSVKIPSSTESRPTKGFWGTVKRLFGGGYERTTVVDVDGLVRALSERLRTEKERFVEAEGSVSEVLEDRLERLNAEVDRRARDLEVKKRVVLEGVQRRQVIAALTALLLRLETLADTVATTPSEQAPSGAHHGWSTTAKAMEPMRVSELTLRLLQLSYEVARNRFVTLRKHVWDEQRPSQAVLWGWDRDALDRIADRFWGDHERSPASDGVSALRVSGEVRAWVIDENALTPHARDYFVEKLREDVDRHAVFVVLDAQAPGSAGSLWVRSPLYQTLRLRRVFAIMQDAHALRRGSEADASAEDASAEAFVASLLEVQALAARARLEIRGVLADDDDVGISLLAHRLVLAGDRLRTQIEEAHWIAEMSQMATTDVAPYIRKWREATTLARAGRS